MDFPTKDKRGVKPPIPTGIIIRICLYDDLFSRSRTSNPGFKKPGVERTGPLFSDNGSTRTGMIRPRKPSGSDVKAAFSSDRQYPDAK